MTADDTFSDMVDWSDVPDVSPADALLSLGIDPETPVMQFVQAQALVDVVRANPFGGGLLPLRSLEDALISGIDSAEVASAVKEALLRVYPPDLEVLIFGRNGDDPTESRKVELTEIDARPIDEETTLFVPAVDPLIHSRTIEGLQQIIARLRAPRGCPWDREQTHQSLTRYLIEEAYEVVQAIETGGPAELAEELGDVLLQILLHAQIAEEAGTFNLEDVFEILATKMIRRHPHVFGDRNVNTAGEVVTAWDQIKQQERSEQNDGATDSIFGSIPPALPALARVQRSLRRAESHGIDVAEVSERVAAALGESGGADELRVAEQLAAVARDARAQGIDAEGALRRWTELFEKFAGESQSGS